jgi:hypothetical protein
VATIVLDKDTLDSWGKARVAIATITGDAAGYLTASGGIALNPVAFGMKVLRGLYVIGANPVAGRLLAAFDPSAVGLRVFYPTGGTQASPAALADPGLSAGGAADNDSIDPGRGKEVLDATDLTTATWTVLAVGI